MKRIHIYLTEEQVAALDAEAARTGLKRSEIVRRWLDWEIWKVKSVPLVSTYHPTSEEAK